VLRAGNHVRVTTEERNGCLHTGGHAPELALIRHHVAGDDIGAGPIPRLFKVWATSSAIPPNVGTVPSGGGEDWP
jgi:hypothetical protein